MYTRLHTHLEALVGERHPETAPTRLRHVETYLADAMRRLGLAVSVQTFEALGGLYRNVIGTIHPVGPVQEGILPEPAPLVVAAHYDTVSGSPGADDNASGLAVLLEAARLLRIAAVSHEIRFVGFCLEEEDLLGSLAYASALRAQGQTLAGAIVLECVGYTAPTRGSQGAPPGLPIPVPPDGDFLAVVGNDRSAGLVQAVTRAAGSLPGFKAVPLVVPGKGEVFPDCRRSDHAAFWEYGYPAVMLTDTANFRNPHYHQATDTLDTLDLDFMAGVAKVVAATVTDVAGSSDAGRPADA